MTLATAEDQAFKFLHCEPSDLAGQLQHCHGALQDTLKHGIGYIHEGSTEKEKAIVERLFALQAIQVVIVEFNMCWSLSHSTQAHYCILMDTQYYDGNQQHQYVDLPITDIMQMMGRACRPTLDTTSKCNIYVQSSKKEYYKKFLYEPLPVESHLDHFLHDHLNSEVITKRIENIQDAIDYLTWTFYYRRLSQNPNYYRMQGVSHKHISDHMSEMVETVLEDLSQSKCLVVDEEQDVNALNLGMIAAFYYLRYTTVELFSQSLTEKVKIKDILDILSESAEFEQLISVRQKEDVALSKLAHHLPIKFKGGNSSSSSSAASSYDFKTSATKTNILLQSHFSRVPLNATITGDLNKILPVATRLLQAIVDVISSSRWLAPALAAMELTQMITMGMWNTDLPLMQVPHIDQQLARKLAEHNIKSVADLLEMEDEDRVALLQLPMNKMNDIAMFANVYPDIGVQFKLSDEGNGVRSGAKQTLMVQLERASDDDEEEEDEDEDDDKKPKSSSSKEGVVPIVIANRYPQVKTEGWWIVLGNPSTNELHVIKRMVLKNKQTNVNLDFTVPKNIVGKHVLTLFLMSDSWIGADQEYQVELDVQEALEGSDMEDASEGDE
jgi:pre-mRNA-splicing helicase BRR2